jgi:hypothetical protein
MQDYVDMFLMPPYQIAKEAMRPTTPIDGRTLRKQMEGR